MSWMFMRVCDSTEKSTPLSKENADQQKNQN